MNKAIILICSAAMGVLIFMSDAAAAICRDSLMLCAETVIPSLFPFFILSGLINRMGLPQYLGRLLNRISKLLFGVSGAGATALSVGLTGGYPMGAAYIAEMYGQEEISLAESERLLAFCNNSGPAFIIGAVGCGVFHSAKLGLMLYGVHIAAAVTTGILLNDQKGKFRFPVPERKKLRHTNVSFSEAFTHSVSAAVVSILNICGYIVCFSLIVKLLLSGKHVLSLFEFLRELTGLDVHWFGTFFCGIFELGSSLGEMRYLSPVPGDLSLAAFILGWGGLSVFMQTKALLSDTEIKGTLHITGHLLCASISSVYAYILFSFIS